VEARTGKYADPMRRHHCPHGIQASHSCPAGLSEDLPVQGLLGASWRTNRQGRIITRYRRSSNEGDRLTPQRRLQARRGLPSQLQAQVRRKRLSLHALSPTAGTATDEGTGQIHVATTQRFARASRLQLQKNAKRLQRRALQRSVDREANSTYYRP